MEYMQETVSKKMRAVIHMSRRRRNFLIAIAVVAGTGYGFYRMYKSPSIARKRYRLVRFVTSLLTIMEAASASAETITLVSNDLKNFLQSDSDEIPASLKQLLKAACCPEFRQTLTGVSGALTAGVLQGFAAVDGDQNSDDPSPGVAERMVDKLFTPAGTGFVSVVTGSFARNLVLAAFEYSGQNSVEPSNSRGSSPRPSAGLGFVDVICSTKGRELVGECIQRFVSTAVSVYLDKTMHINTYDEICAALVNPAHQAQMKGFLMSVCNGAVETLIRTSHEVLTNVPSSTSRVGSGVMQSKSKSPTERQVKSDNLIEHKEKMNTGLAGPLVPPNYSQRIQLRAMDGEQIVVEANNLNSGVSCHNWIDKVSYTLAIPSNRRLFVEVSGRMMFEAVRSFFEFSFYKFSEFFTRTVPEASHEGVDKVLHVMRYVGDKSIVIATLCFAICLHALTGIRVLETQQ